MQLILQILLTLIHFILALMIVAGALSFEQYGKWLAIESGLTIVTLLIIVRRMMRKEYE